MRLAFMGTPEFAVPALDALVAAGHDVVAVYSQPPRPANRGTRLTPSAVQQRAEELGLHMRTPMSLRQEDAAADFAALGEAAMKPSQFFGQLLGDTLIEQQIGHSGILRVTGA